MARGDRGGIGLRRESVDGGVDGGEGLVGLEEEVAGEPEPRDDVVDDLEVDDDELALGNLVLTVHASSLGRARPLTPGPVEAPPAVVHVYRMSARMRLPQPSSARSSCELVAHGPAQSEAQAFPFSVNSQGSTRCFACEPTKATGTEAPGLIFAVSEEFFTVTASPA